MTQRAFTLIEVIAVVVILGLLATATAWSFARQSQRSSQVDTLGAIAHEDALARQAARRLGQPTALRIDIDRQLLWRAGGSNDLADSRSHTLQLPRTWRIEQIVFPMTQSEPSGFATTENMRRIDLGIVDIPYSTSGRSVTFAMRVMRTMPLIDGDQSQTTWLVFSGLTGQVTQVHDDNVIDNLFATLATRGPDAD